MQADKEERQKREEVEQQHHDSVPQTTNTAHADRNAPQQPVQQPSNGLGIAGMVIGIIALLIAWIPFLNVLSILLGIIGVVLAIVGCVRASNGKASGKGISIAGIVLSALSIVLAFSITGLSAIGLAGIYSHADSDSDNTSVTSSSKKDSGDSNAKTDASGSDDDDKGTSATSAFLDKFNKITYGMSVDDVKNVMGKDGELQSSTTTNLTGTDENYDWHDGIGDTIGVTFSNGQVNGKSYVSLSSTRSEGTATLDAFSAVKNGMSYDDVKSLMGGDGALSTETDLRLGSNDSKMQSYTWNGDPSGTATVAFNDGAVSSMTQYGLK